MGTRLMNDVMDTVFFTADWHLGHSNILRFCDRPFDDIEEHDGALIENANEVVGDGVCYHLGDFSLGRKLGSRLGRLTGEWHFLPGSHDRWMRRYPFHMHERFVAESPLLSLEFKLGGKHPLVVVLCHYAMRVWDRSHYGSLHLYGHSHGKLPGLGKSMDVGVDACGFRPVSLRTVMEKLNDLHNWSQRDISETVRD